MITMLMLIIGVCVCVCVCNHSIKVPIAWGMCNGRSADNTINTCNSGDCTKFIESNGQNGRVLIDQPALWTENWMGA